MSGFQFTNYPSEHEKRANRERWDREERRRTEEQRLGSLYLSRKYSEASELGKAKKAASLERYTLSMAPEMVHSMRGHVRRTAANDAEMARIRTQERAEEPRKRYYLDVVLPSAERGEAWGAGGSAFEAMVGRAMSADSSLTAPLGWRVSESDEEPGRYTVEGPQRADSNDPYPWVHGGSRHRLFSDLIALSSTSRGFRRGMEGAIKRMRENLLMEANDNETYFTVHPTNPALDKPPQAWGRDVPQLAVTAFAEKQAARDADLAEEAAEREEEERAAYLAQRAAAYAVNQGISHTQLASNDPTYKELIAMMRNGLGLEGDALEEAFPKFRRRYNRGMTSIDDLRKNAADIMRDEVPEDER